MAGWTSDELERIRNAEELELASVRRDGTMRRPVTMWAVRHGDDVYVRSVNGRGSSWFRGAQVRHQARIHAGGIEKDVTSRATTRTTQSTPRVRRSTAAATPRSCPRSSRRRRAPRRSSSCRADAGRSPRTLAGPSGRRVWLVPIDPLVRGSRARPGDVNGEAGRIRVRFDELEVQRGGEIPEQGEPGAERGRLDHESVLVDQPES
jgi:hypothetical protein